MNKTGLSVICMIAFVVMSNYANAIIYSISDSPYFINEDIIIPSSETLEIEAGVTFYIAPEVKINIEGPTKIIGTNDAVISFLPQIPELGWDKIEIFNGSHTISHVLIEEGVLWTEDSSSDYSFIEIRNSQNLPFSVPFMRFISGSSTVHNCTLSGINKGEGILIFHQNNVSIRNCKVTSVPDAIEISNIQGGIIDGNELSSMNDDAIDLNNCHNVIIRNNIINEAADRGFEIGSQNFGSSSNIILRRNIVTNCGEGVSIKEGSSAWIYHNTFYGNNVALVVAEEVLNTGASYAFVENSIFSQSTGKDVLIDRMSNVDIQFSISDINVLPGLMNLLEEVQFVNPKSLDFSLVMSSPAIDAGNPNSLLDADCSIPDMGAIESSQCQNICLCDLTALELIVSPNPFNSSINLTIGLEKESDVQIDIYNIVGNLIRSIDYQMMEKGISLINIIVDDFVPGPYLLKAHTNEKQVTTKLIKLR